MRFFSILYVVILVFGLCSALPIKSSAIDNQPLQNKAILGILGFISIGALLGACICCGRRKRGFEEFTNEGAAAAESHVSEFPIFRALSPDQESTSRPTSSNASPAMIVTSNQLNVTRDHLLDQDMDNNNGPISPADLENIENNNAVDYIPNRNEIGVVIETNFTVNRNLAASAPSYPMNAFTHPLCQDINVPSTSSGITTSQYNESPSCYQNPINEVQLQAIHMTSDYRNPFTNINDVPINMGPVSQSNSSSSIKKLEINNQILDTNIRNPFLVERTANDGDKLESQQKKVFERMRDVSTNYEENILKSSEERRSNRSFSSERSSSDINSVDEAILALDNVLADEDTADQDDDDDEEEEDITLDAEDVNYQNVIRQFLMDGVNNISQENMEIQSSLENDSLRINIIRDEATVFVDNVLTESKKVVDEINIKRNAEAALNSHKINSDQESKRDNINVELSETNENVSTSNDTKCLLVNDNTDSNPINKSETNIVNIISQTFTDPIIDYKAIDLTTLKPHKNIDDFSSASDDYFQKSSDLDDSSYANNTVIDLAECDNVFEKVKTIANEDNSPTLCSTDSMENLFFDDMLEASTPFIKNKLIKDTNPRAILNEKLSQKLIFDKDSTIESSKIVENLDDIEILENSIETYPLPSNEILTDLTHIINSQTFLNDDNIKFNEDTFITEQPMIEQNLNNPPEIRIDKEESNSVDMTTVTPVNTPSELNYSLETWDRFITKSFNQNLTNKDDVFNVNQASTSSGSGGGSGESGSNTNGWFLHPPNNNMNNETFDVEAEEENEENMSLTIEALRKQLSEMLPHAQGMAGPPEYSDEEDSSTQNDRPFEEYRAPFNNYGIKYGELDEASNASLPPPPNEIIINYKRALSPIMEESEDETCKTFVMNETRYLDSTSPGCMESGEAALGVTKPLMASNDTLFNLEDTFGDDPFSPRACSQTDLNIISQNFEIKLQNDDDDTNNNDDNDEKTKEMEDKLKLDLDFVNVKRFKSFDLISDDGDLCSPDQVKTFSEEILSTGPQSSDLSVTADQDGTFTTNEEKTCITVGGDMTYVKEDERISEISEPEWGSTMSYNKYDDNSLMDVYSLDAITFDDLEKQNELFLMETDLRHVTLDDVPVPDFNLNGNQEQTESDIVNPMIIIDDYDDIEKSDDGLILDISDEKEIDEKKTSDNDNEKPNNEVEDKEEKKIELESECDEKLSDVSLNSQKDKDKDEGISSKEESGNETESSANDENDKISCGQIKTENPKNYKNSSNNESNTNITGKTQERLQNLSSQIIMNPNILDFLNKEIEHASSQYYGTNRNNINENGNEKKNDKNSNPDLITDLDTNENIDLEQYRAIEKLNAVRYKLTNAALPVLIQGNDSYMYDIKQPLSNGNGPKKFLHLDIIRPNKYQPVIGNYAVYDIDGENEEHGMMVADAVLGQCLSGEEDPWANHPLGDIHFNGPNSEIISTSFNMNEWESEDDSNSSEEFMYVKGNSVTATPDLYKNHQHRDESVTTTDEGIDSSIWASHEDQIQVGVRNEKENEGESADDSSSDVEEFVPSCWDSMAQPARSALKSPDKSSSNKKRRSVAFKKQRYHSVYEYPREVISLSPSYSEPQIWERDFSHRLDTPDFSSESDILDGFTVSSSARPFHGSQFHAQCNTWPSDSEFSWSQMQEGSTDDQNVKYQNYAESPIEWPRDFGEFFDKDDTKDTVDGDIGRPDSGVGESAEQLESLGDLRHTKGTLRLPLNIVTITNLSPTEKTQKFLDDNFILPTPSCTGSMDSLSSSSGSERPASFTTFGKKELTNNLDDNRLNEIDMKPSIVCIDNDNIINSDIVDITTTKGNHDRSKRQSDSTDEDSGIENIMRSAK